MGRVEQGKVEIEKWNEEEVEAEEEPLQQRGGCLKGRQIEK